MTKQDIFNYVMHSPYNTNPNQLATMLDNLESEGGEEMNVIHVVMNAEDEMTVTETGEEILAMDSKPTVCEIFIPDANFYSYMLALRVVKNESYFDAQFMMTTLISSGNNYQVTYNVLQIIVTDGNVTINIAPVA